MELYEYTTSVLPNAKASYVTKGSVSSAAISKAQIKYWGEAANVHRGTVSRD